MRRRRVALARADGCSASALRRTVGFSSLSAVRLALALGHHGPDGESHERRFVQPHRDRDLLDFDELALWGFEDELLAALPLRSDVVRIDGEPVLLREVAEALQLLFGCASEDRRCRHPITVRTF